MPSYQQNVLLNTNNQSIEVDTYAPLELSIYPYKVVLANKIRKIDYIWGDGTQDTVLYKPILSTDDSTRYFYSEIGDPRNYNKTKKYNLLAGISSYNINVNFYEFGSNNPFQFNVTVKLQKPQLDYGNSPSYDEFHLVKTRMVGVDDNLIYCFEGTKNNNSDLYMSMVNWSKRPVAPPIPPADLPRPYKIVDPYAAKYPIPENDHIQIIPYVFNNSVDLNTDDARTINNLYDYVTKPDLFTNVTNAIDSRILGRDPTGILSIFSVENDQTNTYVRNGQCWASNLDLTGISPWNSDGNNKKGGTLITPRHIIMSADNEISEGSTINFVKIDNTVVTKTITHKLTHPSYSPYFPDLTIGVLNSDVPNDIKYYKLLDNNWRLYVLNDINLIPILYTNANNEALICDGSRATTVDIRYKSPFNRQRQNFYKDLVTPDDYGKPSFMIINNEPILLTTFSPDVPIGGTDFFYQISKINQMIKTLDTTAGHNTGYQVSQVDLSGFQILQDAISSK